MATKTTPTLQVDDRVTRAAARAKDLAPDADIASLELSSRRTGMSFQRTRLSADRTLMSVIRTALSLITFGFTLYQFFERLVESNVIGNAGAGLVDVADLGDPTVLDVQHAAGVALGHQRRVVGQERNAPRGRESRRDGADDPRWPAGLGRGGRRGA